MTSYKIPAVQKREGKARGGGKAEGLEPLASQRALRIKRAALYS